MDLRLIPAIYVFFSSLNSCNGHNIPVTALRLYRDVSTKAASSSLGSSTQAGTRTTTFPAMITSPGVTLASCGGTTINAPNVNPIFWSAGIEEYFTREGMCIQTLIGPVESLSESEIGYSYSTNSPFTPTGNLGAAFTAVVTVYNPDYNPSSTSTPMIVTVTDTAGALATFEAPPVYVSFNPSTVPVTQVLTVADTRADGVCYTITSGAPVMVYTAIEIVESIYQDGSCSPITSWAALPTPVINGYADINGTIADWSEHGVQGAISQSVLDRIENQFEKVDGWVAGTYKGLPTVNVAVYYTYRLGCASPQYILSSADAIIASTSSSRSTEKLLAATEAIAPSAPSKAPSTVFQPSTVAPTPPPVAKPSLSGGGLGGIILSLFQPHPKLTATPSNAVSAAPPPLSTRSAVGTTPSILRGFTLPTTSSTPATLTQSGPTLVSSPKTSPRVASQALATENPIITNSDFKASYIYSSTEPSVKLSADLFLTSMTTNFTTGLKTTAPQPARITANTNSDLVIAGQSVTPGGAAVTISGVVISVAPGATEVLVRNDTTNLDAPTSAPIGQPFQGGTAKSFTCSGWSGSLCGCLGVILIGTWLRV